MAFFRQLRVILWKNIVVYSFKRHYFLTFFTMFIPLVLSAVLVYLRSLGLSDSTQPIVRMNATVYPEFAPSISKSSFPKFVVYAPDTTYVNDIMNAIFNGEWKKSSVSFIRVFLSIVPITSMATPDTLRCLCA
uniref:Putative retinal-specific rim abc transporter n=1 Tax=Ixodes ricinus TaxID=34613 RepID=A0A6B0URN5_IXORI